MQIKTITCHDVYNLGASLQAYALMKYLENCGHDVEIIDYKPFYLDHYFDFTMVSPRFDKPIIKWLYLIVKFPSRIAALKTRDAFDLFKRKYLKITNTRYTTNDDLKNNLPPADCYICGSDMIWNSEHHNGKDPAFFLEFVPDNKRKIAYAASFAIEYIVPEYKMKNQQWINRLDAISVREDTALKILADINIKRGVHVVDPVFLLSATEWNKIARFPTESERYIFVYDFEKNPLIKKIAIQYAKKENCKIFSVYPTSYADRSFPHLAPDEFLAMIKNANLVITNSFHGIAFSIIYRRNFFTIKRQGQAVNSRMESLLRMCNLENRLITDEKNADQILNSNIEYDTISSQLEEKIAFSKKYLEENI